MANDFMEPEELNGEIGSDYDPMGAPINEKPYTKPNVKINPKDLQGDIPEPSFQAPLIDLDKPPLDEVPPTPKKEREPLNKEMNELPKKEKEMAAHHVANMIMQVYEGLNHLANQGMVFNEKKLNKLAQEGEVDFSIRVPINYTTNETITAAEFINDFNSQQKNALKVTQEFKDEVTPILERVLRKRGIGMTDEQMLVFLFGKDIALKGQQFIVARQQMGDIISMLKEQTEEMKKGNFRSQMPTPPPPPPPSPEPQYQYEENPTILETGEEFDESDEQDYFAEEEEEEIEVIGSVQEQVEAQLQRKTVAQLRKEQKQQIESAKASLRGRKVGTTKRGRKKKG
jgi:hypothetical protein